MPLKVGDTYLYDILGHPRRHQPCRLVAKSRNPFNVRKRYLVEFEDGHRMLTGRLLRLPRLARKPAPEERGDG